MSWGMAETASEIEKIKSESADYLNGLNSCEVIDWNTYNYAFDFYEDLLIKAYEQGKKDVQPEPCDDPRADVYYLAEKIGIHRLYALVVALRGEPEPQEDAVSRADVVDMLEMYPFTEYGEYETAREIVKRLPSVEPKHKTGKWIEYDSDEDKYDVIKCPCCKHTFTVDAYHWTDIGFVKDDFKFCPNCGSKNGDARNE